MVASARPAPSLVGCSGCDPSDTRQRSSGAAGQARGRKDTYRKVVDTISKRVQQGTRLRVGLVKIQDDGGQTDALEDFLRDRYDVIELQRAAPTGVVGAHAGPGAWGVFYQRVRDDDPLRH